MLPFQNTVLGTGVGPGGTLRAGKICFVRAFTLFWTFFSVFSSFEAKKGSFYFLVDSYSCGRGFFGRFLVVRGKCCIFLSGRCGGFVPISIRTLWWIFGRGKGSRSVGRAREIFHPVKFELACGTVLLSQVRVDFFTCRGFSSPNSLFL